MKYVVEHVADISDDRLKNVLKNILDTPISPELMRTKNDEVTQKTEDLVGPYLLHDFFMYHFIRWGSSPAKIFELAKIAFKDQFTESIIKKWLKEFVTRFFETNGNDLLWQTDQRLDRYHYHHVEIGVCRQMQMCLDG